MKSHATQLAALVGLFSWGAVWAASPSESASLVLKSPTTADLALGRYLAQSPEARPWQTAAVEIQAFIPKLAERAYLRAIRRLLPSGRPQYQVLAIGGDRTVKQQVIARYISADGEAALLPSASVAITPANYRFRYRGSISTGNSLAYIFEITPRKKRAGLIRGQLWIDSASGLALRQTGYLVRRPSIFVRRLTLTRETSVRDGVAYARTTRLEIDTRLVGRTELTITERPLAAEADEGAGGGQE